MDEEEDEGGSLAPSLFQTVSSPFLMAASVFCGQLVLTFPYLLQSDTFSWPFLCYFLAHWFSWQVNSLAQVPGTCLILAASVCHFPVLSLSKWSSCGHKHVRICGLMSRQVQSHAHQPVSMLMRPD